MIEKKSLKDNCNLILYREEKIIIGLFTTWMFTFVGFVIVLLLKGL